MANLQDVIERLKSEGQLTRNTGTNSIKQTNIILSDVNTNLIEIGKSLGAIRTVGLRGSGGGGVAAAQKAAQLRANADLLRYLNRGN